MESEENSSADDASGSGSGSGSGLVGSSAELRLEPLTPEQLERLRSMGVAQTTVSAARARQLQQGLEQRMAGVSGTAGPTQPPVLWLEWSAATWAELTGVPADLARGTSEQPPAVIAAMLAGDAAQVNQLLQAARQQHRTAKQFAVLLNSRWDAGRINAAIQQQQEHQPGSLPPGAQVHPGCTLLLVAASLGLPAVTESLLSWGCDPRIVDRTGCSPLSAALTACSLSDQLQNGGGPQPQGLNPRAVVELLCNAGGLLLAADLPKAAHAANSAAGSHPSHTSAI